MYTVSGGDREKYDCVKCKQSGLQDIRGRYCLLKHKNKKRFCVRIPDPKKKRKKCFKTFQEAYSFIDEYEFKDPSYYFRFIENGICPVSVPIDSDIRIMVGEFNFIRSAGKLPFAGGLLDQPNYFYVMYQIFLRECEYWEARMAEENRK